MPQSTFTQPGSYQSKSFFRSPNLYIYLQHVAPGFPIQSYVILNLIDDTKYFCLQPEYLAPRYIQSSFYLTALHSQSLLPTPTSQSKRSSLLSKKSISKTQSIGLTILNLPVYFVSSTTIHPRGSSEHSFTQILGWFYLQS